jgi:hypothetical protein
VKQAARDRSLQEHYRLLAAQLAHLQAQLPTLADEAAAAASPFLDEARSLLAQSEESPLRRGLPLSPEEVALAWCRATEYLPRCTGFLRRPDVRAGLAETKKQRRAVRDEAALVRQVARQQLWGQIDSPGFLHRSADETLAMIRDTLANGAPFAGYGAATDGPILERLLLIYFIRATCSLQPQRAAALRAFAVGYPRPVMDAILQYALRIALRSDWDRPGAA